MSVRGVLTGAVFTLIWLWGGHDAVSLSKVNQQISFARNVTPESINLIETDKDSTIAQDSLGIELRALRKKLKNAQVKQFGEGIKVTFESGIFFEFDSFVLTSEARDNIEILTNIIANFESSGILIEGHTDYIGSKSYNQHLSERRASMVAEHLISQGLSPEVIKVKGLGMDKPIADNLTAEGRSMNRRVEIVILGDTSNTKVELTENIVINRSDSTCFYPESDNNNMGRQLCDSWQGRSEALDFSLQPQYGISLPVVINLNDNLSSLKNTSAIQEVDKKSTNKVSSKETILLKGSVFNSKNGEKIDGEIIFKMLPEGDVYKAVLTDSGTFEIELPAGGHYSYMAKAEGFISIHENLYVPEDQKHVEVNQDLYLAPIEIGQTINLNNVFFKQSRSELLPSSYPELDEVVRMMQENESIIIELQGHTDNQGNPYMNLKLSERRVEAIKEYMVGKGINGKRIELKAFGGSKPIASNDSEETRKLNRRVEFVILKQ